MTRPPTEKQLSFRATLLRDAIAKARTSSSYGTPGVTDLAALEAALSASEDDWYIDVRGRRIADLAFVLALPDPADSADCSDQISALKSGGGWGYALDHKDWGDAVLARIAGRWGDDPAWLPKAVTVAELRAVATGARHG